MNKLADYSKEEVKAVLDHFKVTDSDKLDDDERLAYMETLKAHLIVLTMRTDSFKASLNAQWKKTPLLMLFMYTMAFLVTAGIVFLLEMVL